MRALLYIASLFFLLLGASRPAFASGHPSPKATDCASQFSSRKAVKFTHKNQGDSAVENFDFDLEEEHVGLDDYTESNPGNTLIKNSYLRQWYWPTISRTALESIVRKIPLDSAFHSHTTPIYISHRVLRI